MAGDADVSLHSISTASYPTWLVRIFNMSTRKIFFELLCRVAVGWGRIAPDTKLGLAFKDPGREIHSVNTICQIGDNGTSESQ